LTNPLLEGQAVHTGAAIFTPAVDLNGKFSIIDHASLLTTCTVGEA
jgi:hypothetical protein